MHNGRLYEARGPGTQDVFGNSEQYTCCCGFSQHDMYVRLASPRRHAVPPSPPVSTEEARRFPDTPPQSLSFCS